MIALRPQHAAHRRVSDAAVALRVLARGVPRDDVRDLCRPRTSGRSPFLDTAFAGGAPGGWRRTGGATVTATGPSIDVEITSDDMEVERASLPDPVCQDVTERNRATAELVRARERAAGQRGALPAAVRAEPAADARSTTGPRCEIVAVNRALRRDLRLLARGAVRDADHRPAAPRGRRPLPTYLAAHPGGSRPERAPADAAHPWRHRHKDGTIVDVEVTSDEHRVRRSRMPDRAATST